MSETTGNGSGEVMEAAVVSKEIMVRRAGPYILGHILPNSPLKSIVHWLARKDETDDFYTMKILTLKNDDEKETMDDQQGRILIHNEYTLLNLLKGCEGVVQHHGLFKDMSVEQKIVNGSLVSTGKLQTRFCLVTDCDNMHDFSPRYAHISNLRHYMNKQKNLNEFEAITVFYKVVQIVKRLHDLNIVHRDLKLGNFILNKSTGQITIANFSLGVHLPSDDILLKDKRGSPAYISPEVISGEPYLGKPTDMWALGVSLYSLLYGGKFPFFPKDYSPSPIELFNKIKTVDYSFPMVNDVSNKSTELVKSLLVLEPSERLTVSQLLEKLEEILTIFEKKWFCDSDLQVVPMGPSPIKTVASRGVKRTHSNEEKTSLEIIADVETLLTEETAKESNNAGSKTVNHGQSKKVTFQPSIKITRVAQDARVLTMGDLQKLHVIYLANKARKERIIERANTYSAIKNSMNNDNVNRDISNEPSMSTSTATSSNANYSFPAATTTAPTPEAQ